jgi:predicted GIY-YIG superfamily endonuclease
MHLSDDITEDSTISELTTSTNNTDSNTVLSVDSSTTGTDSSDSSSSDSMETSDDDSSDSMSLSSDDTNEDSSSDYTPSASESESDSSTIMGTSDEEESEIESEPETKKRKRNPLDNFCLYTIRPKCPNDTNLYIGSTTDFSRRKSQHKKAVTNKRGGTYYCILYRYIRKCGGWDNFTMEKILDYPCETKHEGLLKEKEYIIKHEATLNSVMPVSDFTERMNDI